MRGIVDRHLTKSLLIHHHSSSFIMSTDGVDGATEQKLGPPITLGCEPAPSSELGILADGDHSFTRTAPFACWQGFQWTGLGLEALNE